MLKIDNRIKVVTLLSTLFISPTLLAVPIPVGLNITGSLTNTQNDAFATQTTTSSVVSGGTSNDVSLVVVGSNLNTNFSETGDSIGFDGSVTGSDTDGVAYAVFGNFYLMDLLVGMNNTSANDYRVIWDFTYDFSADADGSDAFAESAMNFSDTLTSLFSELFISDVAFGDVVGNNFPPTFGDALGTSGSTSFSFDILAGNSASIDGALGLGGGAYDAGSAFLSSLEFGLTIREIEQLNVTPPTPNPTPTPEPLSLGLFGLGLALMLRKRITL